MSAWPARSFDILNRTQAALVISRVGGEDRAPRVGDWSKVQPDSDGEHQEKHGKDDDVTSDPPWRHTMTFTQAPTIVSIRPVAMRSDTAGIRGGDRSTPPAARIHSDEGQNWITQTIKTNVKD